MSIYRRKSKESDLTDSARVLQLLLQSGKSPLSGQFLRWRVWSQWPQIVGETIAEHTEPVGWKEGGTLFIWVKSASWNHHMQFMTDEIKLKLNEFIGERWVKRIIFTLDRKSVPDQSDAGQSQTVQQMKSFLKNSSTPSR